MTLIDIEKIEQKYLNKFYYFLKYAEDEMLKGFQTKNEIKDDWIQYWSINKNSDFNVGAERIVYALFNGKGIGQPNSSPVGADLFFETDDAYIHIDMKTVTSSNIGDFTESIFVGENQNSYKGEMLVQGKSPRLYTPSLPDFYNKGKINEKVCLSYFITILYEKKDIRILNINLLSMPNGALEEHYKHRPLKAGKIEKEARFNFKEVNKFELLTDIKNPNIDVKNSRIKIAYMDTDACSPYVKQLDFLMSLYAQQKE